ncbi:MAG: hypothetical protein JRN42_07165 [Nitrososphaerota archaeon]|nr:hypothetical protein [Nitrososphaerota archaeon]
MICGGLDVSTKAMGWSFLMDGSLLEYGSAKLPGWKDPGLFDKIFYEVVELVSGVAGRNPCVGKVVGMDQCGGVEAAFGPDSFLVLVERPFGRVNWDTTMKLMATATAALVGARHGGAEAELTDNMQWKAATVGGKNPSKERIAEWARADSGSMGDADEHACDAYCMAKALWLERGGGIE